jgi:hypothetical protein
MQFLFDAVRRSSAAVREFIPKERRFGEREAYESASRASLLALEASLGRGLKPCYVVVS